MKDPWAVLGLKPGASQDEVRRAWRAIAARCHPDKGGDAEEFRVAKAAYEYLVLVAPERGEVPGGGSEGPPPRPPEPPPGTSRSPGRPASPGPGSGPSSPSRGPAPGRVIYMRSRLTLGQRLWPFGLANTLRRGVGAPVWALDRLASWAAYHLAPDERASCIRDLLQPLGFWVLATPVTALAWVPLVALAHSLDPSRAWALSVAALGVAWWLVVGVRVVARVLIAGRRWWEQVAAWGPRQRALRRAAREEHRLQRQRARWGY